MVKKAAASFMLIALSINGYSEHHEKKRLKIVSLGPAITENLFLLGAGDNVAADTVYCTRPSAAKNREKIGNVTIVDVEKILSLKPDMVIATSLTNPEQIVKMRNLGIRVEVLRMPRSFNELCDQFMYMGRLVGREQYAKKIVDENRAGVEKIKERTKRLVKKKVFVQLGANPLFTSTRDSFVHDYIDFSGGVNVAGGSKTGFYSREKVISDDPQVILIVTMGITGERERNNWRRYATIDAVKNRRIYIIDSYGVCSPTPATFVRTLKEIAEYLHPDSKVKDGKKDR
ncbi:MAG: ABC transporter substrate-binding protein [Spirochaetes bacterium]|nr:ABC transporter substrate-binding protein [Spirochaetota bacterium]